MIATGMSAKRLITLPLIIALGVWNILYSVNQESSSPFARSTTITVGPDEIHHHKTRKAAAVKAFVQDQQQQQEKEGPRKLNKLHKEGNPSLIFHIGPAHTFTTELQAELTLLSSKLAADKYALAFGNNSLTNFECHKELNVARKKYDVLKKKGSTKGISLKQHILTEVNCWSEALKVLDSHRAKGESLIISDESLSNRWYHFEGLWLAPMDWIVLQETVGDSWNIEIVVGYRRYTEWLPEAVRAASEARYQDMLQEEKPPKLQEEIKVVKPLFPDLVQLAAADGDVVGATINGTYTSTLLERYLYRGTGKSNIPVTLLNVHLDKSVGTTFVCDILYSATTACRASPLHTKEMADAARAASRALKKKNDEPVQAHDFYDFLAAYATKHTMYRIKEVTQQGAVIAARYYQEEIANKTATDFPLKCPTKNELQRLLDVSLKHERTMLPAFADSHDGDDEHRRHFLDAAHETKMLCQIDIKKILRIVEWRSFFRSLPNGVPEELLPVKKNKAPKKNSVGMTRDFISSDNKVVGKVTTIRYRKVAP